MKIINHSHSKLFQAPIWILLLITSVITVGTFNFLINPNRYLSSTSDAENNQNGILCKCSRAIAHPYYHLPVLSAQSLLPYAFFLNNVSQELPLDLADWAMKDTAKRLANDKDAVILYRRESSQTDTLLGNMDSFAYDPEYILRSINKIYHRFALIF